MNFFHVVDSDYEYFLQSQRTNRNPQKSKATQQGPTSSSLVAEYVPRSETGTFRTSLSHKSSERGSYAEINKPTEGTFPRNPILSAFKEALEGESPEVGALNMENSGEEALEATLGDVPGDSITSDPTPEPPLQSEPLPLVRTIPLTNTSPTLSSEELAVLKKDNPLAYLKAILSARESLTDKSVSASTASGEKDPNDPCNTLLKKLKTTFFGADLFQVLKSNIMANHDLKALLK